MIGAMDISWYPDKSNEYLSIVISKPEIADSILKRLGYGTRIHMTRIGDRKRRDILSRLSFQNDGILAVCARIDRTVTLETFLTAKHDNTSIRKTWKKFDYLLFRYLDPVLTPFLVANKCALTDVTFQCDDDCIGIVRTKGLRHAPPGGLHSLADAAAWGNSHMVPLAGMREFDFVEPIRRDMRA